MAGILHPYRPSATEQAEAAERAARDIEKQAADAAAVKEAELESRILKNKGQLELFAA